MAAKQEKSGVESALDVLREKAEQVEQVATKQSRKHFFDRMRNLRTIRGNLVLWLGLLLVLIAALVLQTIFYNQSYQTRGPADGGAYVEGMVGSITSFNPLYAATEDEIAISRLLYSSLISLDDTNRPRPSVARSYTVSSDGLAYDVKLRSNVKWHNSDTVVTADDVLFTLGLIKNPAVGSSLYDTWRSIRVDKVDNDTVRFTLRSPLAIFPLALTFGILSVDELGEIDPTIIREYTTDHVVRGTGPFVYHSTSASQADNRILTFSPNPNYFLGVPRVASLSIETFDTPQAMIDGWRSGEINVATDLPLAAAQSLAATDSSNLVATPINGGVYAIFNTAGSITKNKAIRQALRLASDLEAVRSAAAAGEYRPRALNSPIAPGIYENIDQLVQPTNDLVTAARLLDTEGWAMGPDKMRFSGDKPFVLQIVTLRDSAYVPAAQTLAEQWRGIGVNAQVILAEPGTIQQNYIIPRNFDVLVYQLQLGTDPDVYAYWHSSGARAQGLNLANYNSAAADVALSRGRSGNNREYNYKVFVDTWLGDVPAIALYQSDYFSLQSPNIINFTAWRLSDESDRFRNVIDFSVNTRPVFKTP